MSPHPPVDLWEKVETSIDNLFFLQLNKQICNSGKDSNISKLECWWHTCMKYLGRFHQNMIAQVLISSDKISSGSSQHRKSDIYADHWVFGKSSGMLQHNQASTRHSPGGRQKTVLPIRWSPKKSEHVWGWTLFFLQICFPLSPSLVSCPFWQQQLKVKSPILGHCPCTEIFPNSRILKTLKKVFRKDDQCVANVIIH